VEVTFQIVSSQNWHYTSSFRWHYSTSDFHIFDQSLQKKSGVL